MKHQDIEKYFACPTCKGGLEKTTAGYRCAHCDKKYAEKDGQVYFGDVLRGAQIEAADDIVFRVKNYFKEHFPWIFFLIYSLVAIVTGKTAKSIVRTMPEGALMLNIGSGAKRIDPRVINVDLIPEQGIDIVASAYELPFKDGSVDLVISENILEHLEYPERAVAEIHRVLKTGGSIFIVTPFMLGFHSSPDDFYRWTLTGMKLLLKDFTILDLGVYAGPTAALVAMLREWFAILLSFNSRKLYQFWTLVFMIVLIPLNIFDLLLARYTTSSQIALLYYWVGKKE